MGKQSIRWGILGTGQIAGQFAEALGALPDADLIAVASRRLETAERFARRFQISRSYDSYQNLLNDADVDVVYIATPHSTHHAYSLLALEMGKPILCEKPFTMNGSEAREVVNHARQKNLFAMEAMWMRFTPAVKHARELVSAGAIGELRYIEASLSFRVPYTPEERRFDPQLGGGSLLDLGVYPLSFIFQFLGKPDHIETDVRLAETGVDRQSITLLGYESGQQGVIISGFDGYGRNDALLVGTKGRLNVSAPLYKPESLALYRTSVADKANNVPDGPGLRERIKGNRVLGPLYDYTRRLRRRLAPAGERFHHPISGTGYQFEAMEVMHCLRNNLLESPIMPLDETVAIMDTMDAIRDRWGLVYPQEQNQ